MSVATGSIFTVALMIASIACVAVLEWRENEKGVAAARRLAAARKRPVDRSKVICLAEARAERARRRAHFTKPAGRPFMTAG